MGIGEEKNIVISQLKGGLGNQLFQYAAAKSLAHHLQASLKLDITTFKHSQTRLFKLDYFCIPLEIAAKEEIGRFICFPSLYRHSPKFFSIISKHIYREPYFHYNEHFFNLKKPIYLDGYWQSYKYFDSIEKVLREELTIKDVFIKHFSEKINELRNINSIAIHIRRGDYTIKRIADFHGVLPVKYYNEAIQIMTEKINNPKFYFFSDDINWVKENIQISHPHEFVTSYTKSAIEDFYLMSQCKHNIIANSSFSWWAAWLNPNPSKIVIAPKKWFNKSPHNTTDLIPNEWIKL